MEDESTRMEEEEGAEIPTQVLAQTTDASESGDDTEKDGVGNKDS